MNHQISSPSMHVSLHVKDIAQTVSFYNQFFGQEASKVKPKYAKYELERPALVISFVEDQNNIEPGFGHLGYRVSSQEDLNLQLALARKNGLVQLEEEGTACCYAIQDKFWVADPDGYRWEVYYFHGDTEQNDPEYDLEGQNACCAPEDKEKAQLNTEKAALCC